MSDENIETRLVKLEVKVDRNELDLEKTIESLSSTRDAANSLVNNMRNLDLVLKDVTKTLYGGEDRKNSLVSIVDSFSLNIESLNSQFNIIKRSNERTISALNKYNDHVLELKNIVDDIKKQDDEEDGSIGYGKFKLSGPIIKTVSAILVMLVTVIIILVIVYFGLATHELVPWPWEQHAIK